MYNYSQSQPEEGAGAPLVLIDHHPFVVEDGVVHHEGGTGEVTGRELIDHGGTLVEDHVEAHVLCLLALAAHGHVVAVIDHEGGQHGEVKQPTAAQYPVVAVAAPDADVAHVDARFGSIGTSRQQVVGGLDAASLITDAGQPRASRPPLDVTLREGGGEGETPVVERVVGRHVEHLHRRVALLQTLRHLIEQHVARERLRPLVTEVEAQAAAVAVEVELIVLIGTSPLGRVDGHAYADAPIDGRERERGLVTGAQVSLRIDIVHHAPGMERVARLVHPHLQRQPSLRAHHVVRVVGRLVVSL